MGDIAQIFAQMMQQQGGQPPAAMGVAPGQPGGGPMNYSGAPPQQMVPQQQPQMDPIMLWMMMNGMKPEGFMGAPGGVGPATSSPSPHGPLSSGNFESRMGAPAPAAPRGPRTVR